ncbi:hypothetical protein A4X13_0g8624 [Tilletia indica]|uniref:Uncharacterized protein n=1 Tax=Tilletia indica TaxID=43049 RepID=A0A177TUP2_9BASI|nr:hypothetical protein A4X13_0g8624 [Tilletia indica]
MRFTSSILAFAIGATLAVPTLAFFDPHRSPSPVVPVVEDVVEAAEKLVTVKERGRTSDTFCYGSYKGIFNSWGVKSRTNTIGLRDGGASGFLDQLRGHCGDITNYQVNYQTDDDEGHWAVIYFFNADEFCQPGDIADAARAAGGPQLVCDLN